MLAGWCTPFRPKTFGGAVAQLGERLHGMQEVDGSIPFSSTNSIGRRRVRDVRPGDRPLREAPVMVFVLIVLAAASRLLPHPPNFAPVAAIGLFAGAMIGRRAGWLVPFVALLASDLVLGFYHPV